MKKSRKQSEIPYVEAVNKAMYRHDLMVVYAGVIAGIVLSIIGLLIIFLSSLVWGLLLFAIGLFVIFAAVLTWWPNPYDFDYNPPIRLP